MKSGVFSNAKDDEVAGFVSDGEGVDLDESI